MSRLLNAALAVLSWENNHRRQIVDCLDSGCSPSQIEDIRKELRAVVKSSDESLSDIEIQWLVDFEIRGFP